MNVLPVIEVRHQILDILWILRHFSDHKSVKNCQCKDGANEKKVVKTKKRNRRAILPGKSWIMTSPDSIKAIKASRIISGDNYGLTEVNSHEEDKFYPSAVIRRQRRYRLSQSINFLG